ncbi:MULTISPECIES: LysR family transcriptional regulator [Paraburkholderia]|uniref:LysR family transcriptional regulator n=1 Tax=Paraburkholderia dipogonis TaxID=1211383 RepID=A0A4Y8MH04_9BURK|nr:MULTISPECIES: LysR family transcriptional regulator [Paraburkholderia]RKR31365.1 DNA-binding transcriptional LysR family regulator [Paraburkholderia sp. BL17N1]TFE36673.1 LysR family transcriptional regulator [Paraburkholderia dipogonis]
MMSASFVNQWVSLIKDTSLAYVVGVPEFTFLANQVNSRLMVYPAQIFVFVGLIYLVSCCAFQWDVPRLLAGTAGLLSRPSQDLASALPVILDSSRGGQTELGDLSNDNGLARDLDKCAHAVPFRRGKRSNGMAKWQPDIFSLTMFAAVCEEESISRAAQRMSVVPSAVSKRMSEIESQAGVSLLVRGGRGVRPTTAGLTLLHHARTIMYSVEKLQAELAEHVDGVRGHITVFANASSIAQYLPRDIARFLSTHSGIRVDLDERISPAVVQGVVDGSAELGVCLQAQDLDQVEWFPYASDRLVVVVHPDHPLAAQEAVEFSDTFKYDFVGLQQGSRMANFLAAQAVAAGKDINFRMRVSTYEAACHIVAEDLAIAVLAHDSVKLMQNALGLRVIELMDPWAKRELILCVRHKETLQPPAHALFDWLKARGATRVAH